MILNGIKYSETSYCKYIIEILIKLLPNLTIEEYRNDLYINGIIICRYIRTSNTYHDDNGTITVTVYLYKFILNDETELGFVNKIFHK